MEQGQVGKATVSTNEGSCAANHGCLDAEIILRRHPPVDADDRLTRGDAHVCMVIDSNPRLQRHHWAMLCQVAGQALGKIDDVLAQESGGFSGGGLSS